MTSRTEFYLEQTHSGTGPCMFHILQHGILLLYILLEERHDIILYDTTIVNNCHIL